MKVLKFGGSSVASAENIDKVVAIVKEKSEEGKLAVFVSALSGVTDKLIAAGKAASQGNEEYKDILNEIENRHLAEVRKLVPIANQSSVLSQVKKLLNDLENTCEGVFLIGELSAKTLDRIMSKGELLSSFIISEKMKAEGLNAVLKDSRELIKTDSNFGKAAVDFETTNLRSWQYFNQAADVTVLPGFVASNENGETTTMGRGGSDYSAAIVAGAINAEVLEIWTDVSGMMTADPRVVSQAYPIEKISYGEAFELSHFGAKVIYPPTIQPVLEKKIPVWVKNTFAPDDAGTLIHENGNGNDTIIKGISSINKIALLSLEGSGMVGVPGFSKRLFEALAREAVNVILITQSSSEHSICVAINEADIIKAKTAIDSEFAFEISVKKVDPLIIERELSIVALIGDKMKNHAGVSGKMFSALGRNGINIRAIAQGSSEKNISTVINEKDVKKGLNVLHEEFFEKPIKQLNLFITGAGNVGSKLLDQLKKQQRFLTEELRLNVRVVGLANSKKMIFNDEGICLENWKEQLSNGEPMSLTAFAKHARVKNMRNSVFVDNSASEDVAQVYKEYLKSSISVVTCNKIAAASEYQNYRSLKRAAMDHNVRFLFETNVGAGLPIIGTLNDMVRSGDRIRKIEAVLSGSLNFIFNNFKTGVSFEEIVRQAQTEGYTEPDPRIDLTGTDVKRKILILIRESGVAMEMDDITSDPFMPADCLEGSVDNFFEKLKEHKQVFDDLYTAASARGEKLKFVATYDNGKASVGLRSVAPDHPLYKLDGKDNIVLFTTDRYPDQPLIVKGAGAGADVTASGIFADIIKTVL
ncbi:bifunctional aspartate kinase/homoserine dehydrogenase I [Solitalea longa]|uniref:Bifunctional aspartate kinase/homoserine dehydrogenase I n=1 Tax=Solitalea longa TaxID=2079460 RepID=A0A2S5AA73_9SPHI|nr:bifunctional aspartate kinase/homoserine dehydrogenase I [Solitalea longa]POY39137.1 bifunctional aspartate kinase/homoserine dehydrogenase I [Solitalea longa]